MMKTERSSLLFSEETSNDILIYYDQFFYSLFPLSRILNANKTYLNISNTLTNLLKKEDLSKTELTFDEAVFFIACFYNESFDFINGLIDESIIDPKKQIEHFAFRLCLDNNDPVLLNGFDALHKFYKGNRITLDEIDCYLKGADLKIMTKPKTKNQALSFLKKLTCVERKSPEDFYKADFIALAEKAKEQICRIRGILLAYETSVFFKDFQKTLEKDNIELSDKKLSAAWEYLQICRLNKDEKPTIDEIISDESVKDLASHIVDLYAIKKSYASSYAQIFYGQTGMQTQQNMLQ